ncbi:hypothetical protein [Amycolatopsis sp. NPDC051071]|uniref:hypothetical protein n=1 Tax=Amycolatopsis sp. NPDC051071 TaxID=3154637 RepID=UPI00341CA892
MSGHDVVKVIFVCDGITEHTLGSVVRQVRAVPKVPAGHEDWQGPGLQVETDTEGRLVKLIGVCPTCRKRGDPRREEMRWSRVRKLLDAAETLPKRELIGRIGQFNAILP